MKDNKFLQGLIGVLTIALIAFVGLKARNASEEFNYIGKAPHDRDTFSIQGEGKVSAKPDLVKISLGVQTDNASVKEAQRGNTQRMNAIIAAMKEFGIESKDIQTTNYSIFPKIDWKDGRQNIIGYSVSQNVEVKIRDLDKVGDVLGKAGELGANQIGGLDFTIDDPKVLQDQAREKAIEDAKKKADLLADKLGLDVVKIVTFSESNGYYPTPRPMMMKADMAVESGAPAPDIQAGSLDVMSNVSVTFEVR